MKTIVSPAGRWASLIALITILFFNAGFLLSQQVYDTFEGVKWVSYQVNKGAQLDTLAANPDPDEINGSEKCARYIRGRQRYDNLKLPLTGKITDVAKYASFQKEAPRIKMKVYTTAPVGTLIEVQLGKRTGNAYPEGTNSQYQAFTKAQGKWQELEFSYVLSPRRSQTSDTDINQLTIVFNPNTNTGDTYYFDDLSGPFILDAPSGKVSKRK